MGEDVDTDGDGAAQDESTPSVVVSRSIMVGDLRHNVSFASQRGLDGECASCLLDITLQARQQAKTAARRAEALTDEEESLAQAVADAGLNVFGCVFVEVWAMSADGTKLARPGGGHWMDPAFAQSLPHESLIEKAWELDRKAPDCPPGAGLAGTMADEGGLGNRDIHWRQIKSMLNDPFVSRGSGKRMESLFEVGIGLVAAVPFSFQDEKGLVLYYSRSTVNVETLRSSMNERYMLISADLIGAHYTIRGARKESSELRKHLFREAIRKVRKEMLSEKKSLASMVMDTDDMAKLKKQMEMEAAQDEEELPRVDKLAVKLAKCAYKAGKKILKRVNNSRRKWRGAKLHGPPRQSFSDSVFAFVGCFITMLTILKIERTVRGVNSAFDFDAGWYTSILCIVYSLTPAPVGQPRQIYAAHLWNMLIGLACRQIPTEYIDFMEWRDASPGNKFVMPLIWVQALAVALGVSGQAFIGILHPPATGLSMTFASNPKWTWSTIASVMLADTVVVVISMMYLNLSEKKQYPLYWLGLGWQGGSGTTGLVRRRASNARRNVVDTRKSIESERKANGEDVV